MKPFMFNPPEMLVMSVPNMNSKSVRAVRRIELPRPLKSNRETNEKVNNDVNLPKKTVAESWYDLQTLCSMISDCNYDENTPAVITRLCSILKTQGQELDSTNKSLMDHYFAQIRNVTREDRLDIISRLKLLEIIEMRAMKWQANDNFSYYMKKISELEGGEKVPSLISPSISHSYSCLLPNQSLQNSTPAVSIPLAPGEILRSSGKYAKPTKIAGKNYFKDEVVIRNSDSGKVMGIKGRRVHMIEELSDTIISFQRVNPGARDRLVQITGPNEESISHAKTLVEDTIKRNASPLREKGDSLTLDAGDSTSLMTSISYEDMQDFSSRKQQLAHSFSMSDATLGEYTYKINIGVDFITLSGSNAELLKHAKVALQSYFSSQGDEKEKSFSLMSNEQRYENSKNKLEHSLSWMGSVGCSSSESLSDEDIPKLKRSSSIHSPIDSRKTSLNSESEEIGTPIDLNKIYIMEKRLSESDEIMPSILPPEPKKIIRTYSREMLVRLAKSPFCFTAALKLNEEVVENFPFILRNSAFRKDGTSPTFL